MIRRICFSNLANTDCRSMLFKLAAGKITSCPFDKSGIAKARFEVSRLMIDWIGDNPKLWVSRTLDPIFEEQADPIQFKLLGLLLYCFQDPEW